MNCLAVSPNRQAMRDVLTMFIAILGISSCDGLLIKLYFCEVAKYHDDSTVCVILHYC